MTPTRRGRLVQDTYLRAWRAREQYDETRSSLRTWLYRIATNACLTALEIRGRRPLPSGLVAASDPLGPLVRGEDVAWLQPLPDSLLDAGDPARAVIDRSSLRLAFAAALQHLSARQRGALILRDVLGFSASEAAEILGTTVVSVNSSLQRARTRVKEAGVRQERRSEPSAAEQRAWVDRYMKAFEHADVEGLKRLLTEDVLMEMPPIRSGGRTRRHGLTVQASRSSSQSKAAVQKMMGAMRMLDQCIDHSGNHRLPVRAHGDPLVIQDRTLAWAVDGLILALQAHHPDD